jgi:hypothetical protein
VDGLVIRAFNLRIGLCVNLLLVRAGFRSGESAKMAEHARHGQWLLAIVLVVTRILTHMTRGFFGSH